MITPISRTIQGTYIAANTTIMFPSNPYLQANAQLLLNFTNNDSKYSTTVTSVSGNNVVVTFNNKQYSNTNVIAKTNQYGSGITGPQTPFTWSFTNYPAGIIQVSSTGGTSYVNVEASVDNQNWIQLANLAITTANSNTAYTTVNAPWPYGRLNISTIAASNSITVNKAT